MNPFFEKKKSLPSIFNSEVNDDLAFHRYAVQNITTGDVDECFGFRLGQLGWLRCG